MYTRFGSYIKMFGSAAHKTHINLTSVSRVQSVSVSDCQWFCNGHYTLLCQPKLFCSARISTYRVPTLLSLRDVNQNIYHTLTKNTSKRWCDRVQNQKGIKKNLAQPRKMKRPAEICLERRRKLLFYSLRT